MYHALGLLSIVRDRNIFEKGHFRNCILSEVNKKFLDVKTSTVSHCVCLGSLAGSVIQLLGGRALSIAQGY